MKCLCQMNVHKSIIIIFALFLMYSIIACVQINTLESGNQDAKGPKVAMKEYSIDGCGTTPNCVSTKEANPNRYIAPLSFKQNANEAWQSLLRIVKSSPRFKVLKQDEYYVHLEASSKLFGFKDDIEFLLDEKAKLIHMRSASRIGLWDMGANRRRIEAIRNKWEVSD